MVMALTSEDRLRQVDEAMEEVKQELVEVFDEGFVKALETLSRSDEVDPAFFDRIKRIDRRLGELPGQVQPDDFDIEQLHELHTNLHAIRDLMRDIRESEEASLDTLNEILIRVEAIRHIIRDALDEHVSGIAEDAGRVLGQLAEWLPQTPQRELARLVGVDRRTLNRWSSLNEPPRRRLRLVAQLVAILRHSWTEEGVVAWFDRPNRDLKDKKPLAVLDDASYEHALLMAARATRSQYAT